MVTRRGLIHFLIVSTLLAALVASAPGFASAKPQASDGRSLDSNTQFYVPKPNHGAIEQIADLTSSGDKADAKLIKEMIETPQAVWFTSGTPKSVQQDVKNTVQRAADKGTVPVLVAYNIPFRDCAQFSAGGATTVAEYKAWIDGFAAGIGNGKAVVILEPDGLGIIPWYNPFADRDAWVTNPNYEWCQPAEADSATAAADRFAMLNYAVDELKAQPGHQRLSRRHAQRLAGRRRRGRPPDQAGVERCGRLLPERVQLPAQPHLEKYGTWISKCIAFASNPASWGSATPSGAQANISRRARTTSAPGLSPTSGTPTTSRARPGGTRTSLLKHFVIDTSRNGQGPWTPTASYPDAQDWCNPPDRGLGLRPTANTGEPLVDAYLWVKIPGESDGECTRGLGPAARRLIPSGVGSIHRPGPGSPRWRSNWHKTRFQRSTDGQPSCGTLFKSTECGQFICQERAGKCPARSWLPTLVLNTASR